GSRSATARASRPHATPSAAGSRGSDGCVYSHHLSCFSPSPGGPPWSWFLSPCPQPGLPVSVPSVPCCAGAGCGVVGGALSAVVDWAGGCAVGGFGRGFGCGAGALVGAGVYACGVGVGALARTYVGGRTCRRTTTSRTGLCFGVTRCTDPYVKSSS